MFIYYKFITLDKIFISVFLKILSCVDTEFIMFVKIVMLINKYIRFIIFHKYIVFNKFIIGNVINVR